MDLLRREWREEARQERVGRETFMRGNEDRGHTAMREWVRTGCERRDYEVAYEE